MVSFETAKDGIAYYIDRNIMSRYPADGWQKLLAGSIVAITLNNYADKLRYSPIAKTIGIVTDEGFEIEPLAAEIKRRIPSNGIRVSIPMLGEALFREADIDDIVETIKGRR